MLVWYKTKIFILHIIDANIYFDESAASISLNHVNVVHVFEKP